MSEFTDGYVFNEHGYAKDDSCPSLPYYCETCKRPTGYVMKHLRSGGHLLRDRTPEEMKEILT